MNTEVTTTSQYPLTEALRQARAIRERLEDTYKISIDENGIWAGNGILRGTVIDDCDAVLSRDEQEQDYIYDAIGTAAAESSEMSGSIEISGTTWGWSLTEIDVSDAEAAVEEAQEALASSDEPRQWRCGDDGASWTITASSVAEALEKSNSGYDAPSPEEGTTWVHISCYCEDTGEDGSTTLAIDPEEPDCYADHEHDWLAPHSVVGGLKENPGVTGNGGGVVMEDVCRHCGRYRVTNTWAQDPYTGEQGLESVSYRDPDEASKRWVEREVLRAAMVAMDGMDEVVSYEEDFTDPENQQVFVELAQDANMDAFEDAMVGKVDGRLIVSDQNGRTVIYVGQYW